MLTKNQLRIKILPEKEKDFEDINKLLIEAFKDEEHSSHDEHLLVQKLRTSSSYLPRLTLTAKINEELVGFIMFTKAYIGDYEVLALAPLAVSPKYQNQKIGTSFNRACHQLRKKADKQRVVQEVGFLFCFAVIHINAVSQRLKCIKGNTHHCQHVVVFGNGKGRKQFQQSFHKKVKIFKIK